MLEIASEPCLVSVYKNTWEVRQRKEHILCVVRQGGQKIA